MRAYNVISSLGALDALEKERYVHGRARGSRHTE